MTPATDAAGSCGPILVTVFPLVFALPVAPPGRVTMRCSPTRNFGTHFLRRPTAGRRPPVLFQPSVSGFFGHPEVLHPDPGPPSAMIIQ